MCPGMVTFYPHISHICSCHPIFPSLSSSITHKILLHIIQARAQQIIRFWDGILGWTGWEGANNDISFPQSHREQMTE